MNRTTFRRPQSQQDNHGVDHQNVHGGHLPSSPTQKNLILGLWLQRNRSIVLSPSTFVYHIQTQMYQLFYSTQGNGAHPAVEILSLFSFPHPLNVRGEDVEQSTEHGVRLRPAQMFGKQTVHNSGALHNKPGNILRRRNLRRLKMRFVSAQNTDDLRKTILPEPGHYEMPAPPLVHAGIGKWGKH